MGFLLFLLFLFPSPAQPPIFSSAEHRRGLHNYERASIAVTAGSVASPGGKSSLAVESQSAASALSEWSASSNSGTMEIYIMRVWSLFAAAAAALSFLSLPPLSVSLPSLCLRAWFFFCVCRGARVFVCPSKCIFAGAQFVKELCEGHNLESQNLFRVQDGAEHNFNIVSGLCSFLDVLVSPPPAHGAGLSVGPACVYHAPPCLKCAGAHHAPGPLSAGVPL